MAVNRSNRRPLRANRGRSNSLPASPVARPIGRPTPSTLPPAGPIRQASPSRASVSPSRASVSPIRRPQGESPVIRPSRETGGNSPKDVSSKKNFPFPISIAYKNVGASFLSSGFKWSQR